ncbi:MAG: class I SAM-dependent methyltransferase [Pseudomonadota bacterium]
MSTLKKIISSLKFTPLHPQWFAHFRASKGLKNICQNLNGTVLDIGCADSKPKDYMPSSVNYIGLDYYDTATNWYKTKPNLFGDAAQLPINSSAIDHCLLLDVLEHLPVPSKAIAEINRILKPDGKFFLQVPFLYPIHDAPLDFHRWTEFGLCQILENENFKVLKVEANGHPLETAALNMCIALSKTCLNWIEHRNPLAMFTIVLPPLILALNLLAWTFAKFDRETPFMPYGYRISCVKTV